MRDVDRALAELAVHQNEVFSREQARAHGLSPSALSRRIASKQIVACGPQSLHFAGVQLTYHGRLRAGLFDLGPDAAIGGRAAANFYGLDGFRRRALEFVTIHSRRRRTSHTVHSVAEFGPLDRWIVDGMAVTSPTLTVAHLSAWGTEEEAANALDSACRTRLTSIPELREHFAGVGRAGRAGVARFERTVRSAVVDSWLERRFLKLLGSAGLPRPTVQQRHELPGIGVVRVDFEYSFRSVVIEVGGRLGYMSNTDRHRKERRRNALQVDGTTVYFFTRADVVDDPAYVLTTVAAALGITVPALDAG